METTYADYEIRWTVCDDPEGWGGETTEEEAIRYARQQCKIMEAWLTNQYPDAEILIDIVHDTLSLGSRSHVRGPRWLDPEQTRAEQAAEETELARIEAYVNEHWTGWIE